MNLARLTTLAAAAMAAGLFLLPASHVFAQGTASTPSVSSTAPPPPNVDRPPGNRDDFRQRMAERIKSQLKASDDEWTVIQPLLEKVNEKLMASRGGGFGGPGGFGGNREGGRRREGNNAGGNNPDSSPGASPSNNQGGGNPNPRREGERGPRGNPETQALAATLADDNTTVNDVKAKLQAVRDQRKQAAAELAQAREELRKVLNVRQEAALVMYGLLD